MFKSGVCPYCGSTIEYKKRSSAIRENSHVCRKCMKRSTVRFKQSGVMLGIIFAVVLIALNVLMFAKGHNKTVIPNFVITIGAIILYLSLLPLTTEFIRIESEDPPRKLKKNRRRHIRDKRKGS